MMYYLKKITKQDVTKTPVVSGKSLTDFFKVSIPNRDDQEFVDFEYIDQSKDLKVIKRTKFQKKQDNRLYLRENFELLETVHENDFFLFTKADGNIQLESIAKNDIRGKLFLDLIDKEGIGNHLITTDNNENKQRIERIQYLLTMSLNTILFGPPGTGKTYSTIEKSLEILNQHSLNSDVCIKNIENRENFKALLNKRIFFVTMHPSYSYEDFVQGLKPTTKDGNLAFEPKDGIFKVASKTALINHQAKKAPKINFEVLFDFAFKPLLEDEVPVEIDHGSTPFKIIKADSTLKFETSTGNTGPTYNLSIKTLKKIYEAGTNTIILSGNKGYFDSLLIFLNKKETELKAEVTSGDSEFPYLNNVVLVLDEINRANISKVFGELITLLEEDKRIGNENELTVTLPSGEVFGVPPNLYIIGTMNTADKSIALVDIALRRRFQFEAMYPKPEIVTSFGAGADTVKTEKSEFMIALNTRLRKDKGVDFQIGHAYFMKDNSLEEVINQNIIPLLTEYYRNDLDKVKKVMNDLGKSTDKDIWDTTGLLVYKS